LVVAVVVALAIGQTVTAFTTTALDLAEEVLIRVTRCPLTLLDEDPVKLAAIEPHPSALRARVDQDLAPLCLDEARSVRGAAKRFASTLPAAELLHATSLARGYRTNAVELTARGRA
jgi:hypothetical protein